MNLPCLAMLSLTLSRGRRTSQREMPGNSVNNLLAICRGCALLAVSPIAWFAKPELWGWAAEFLSINAGG